MSKQTAQEQPALVTAPPTPQQARSLVELLRSWRDGDADEQRETLEYLMRALDEDRRGRPAETSD